MGFAIDAITLGLSCWLLFATFRRLRRRGVARRWWVALSVLSVVGIAAGYWLALYFEYQPSPTFRFIGLPLPLCIFHLEDGQWVDFPLQGFAMYRGVATNIVAVTAFVVLPVLVASLFIHRGQHA